MGRRIRWLGLALIVCFGVVLGQLVNIQYRQATQLNAAKDNPRNLVKAFDNRRGLILAADGEVLAQSAKVKDPKPGEKEYYRQYVTGSLYSGIVGYSSTFYGTSGVEYVYNTDLSLHSQSAKTIGQLLNPPGPTTDSVSLTVIPSLQKLAQKELQTVPDTNKDGAIVVLNATTGAVLAMYSSPTYTNNAVATPTPTKEEAAGKADRTVPDHEGYYSYPPLAAYRAFAPGSTFKVVTSTAVYNLKPTLEGFTYKVSGCTGVGAIPQTTKQICNDADTPTNANPCGGTIAQMLPESCDPGYAMLGLALGGTTLYKQATLFGYDASPPIDITPVSPSHFPTPAELAPTGSPGLPGVAYSAFGQQTVTSTALQGAMVADGIANTGNVMVPHVMSQIRDATGDVVRKFTPTVYKHAASAAAAQAVNQLMQGVVAYGTAAGVGFPATEDVAVKTGTAQAGIGNSETNDWMIGFAPANAPRIAIAVVVPQQPTSTSGAEIAGPIVKAMLGAALAAVPNRTGSAPVVTTPTEAPRPVYTNTGTQPTTTTTTAVVPPATAATTTTAPKATTTTTTTAPKATTTTTHPTTTTTTHPTTTTALVTGRSPPGAPQLTAAATPRALCRRAPFARRRGLARVRRMWRSRAWTPA